MVSDIGGGTRSERAEWEELRRGLRELIQGYRAFDAEKRWVNLDRLWHEPAAFEPYVDIVLEYVRLALEADPGSDTVLLVADTLRSSFGILPAAAVAVHQMGCGLVVWKELGDFTWGLPRFFPEPEPGKTCVILQDVVRWGTTVLKIADDLQSHDWHLRAYLAMVQVSEEKSKLEATLQELRATDRTSSDFRFQALLTTDDLME